MKLSENLPEVSGIYGATRATWRGDRQCGRLQRIVAGNSAGDEAAWRNAFWNEVRNSKDDLREIVEYWLDHNLRSLFDDRSKAQRQTVAARNAAAVAAALPELKNRVHEKVRREAQVMLLTMIAPNGKQLSQCTGADCRRFGSWYRDLADAVPPKKCVGDVMSEGEVRKKWLESKSVAA